MRKKTYVKLGLNIYEKLCLIYGVIGFHLTPKIFRGFSTFAFSINQGSLVIKTFSKSHISISCHLVISYNVSVSSVVLQAYQIINLCAFDLGLKIKKVEIYIDSIE